ncbi:MAG: hypothetical protein HFF99_10845 [Oscillibacter sp.]|jgi:hypothetical protein|nr:hypothetical protein [uncultured Oscillibacter sp.]MCI8971945.1 hypothetical protein [Oscillibacter sp.]
MAEFCLTCWNRMNRTPGTERDYILSNGRELCEGCGRFCRVVEGERTFKFLYDLRHRKKQRNAAVLTPPRFLSPGPRPAPS